MDLDANTASLHRRNAYPTRLSSDGENLLPCCLRDRAAPHTLSVCFCATADPARSALFYSRRQLEYVCVSAGTRIPWVDSNLGDDPRERANLKGTPPQGTFSIEPQKLLVVLDSAMPRNVAAGVYTNAVTGDGPTIYCGVNPVPRTPPQSAAHADCPQNRQRGGLGSPSGLRFTRRNLCATAILPTSAIPRKTDIYYLAKRTLLSSVRITSRIVLE